MAGGAGPAIAINVLGEFAVLRDGYPVDLPPSKKTRALLAYLAVNGRPLRRERLCEIFWDIPDDPRGALRWSLSKLRRVLKAEQDGAIEADRETVGLARDSIALDLDQVAGLAADALGDLETDDLERAASAFRGPFLTDLALPRCPEFEAWRIARADELDFLNARLLETLIERLQGEPERALVHAHALRSLRLDNDGLDATIEALRDRARRAARGPADSGNAAADAPAPRPPAPAAAPPVPRVAAVGADGREQEIRYCTTADGVGIAYAMTGEGPPVVRTAHWLSHLEHDWTSPVWRHWMDALSDGMRLVRYDERGNGLSQREVEDISFEAMLADLEAIVDAAGIERFTLLGVSQGAPISIAYAVRHPERVSGLFLLGGYALGWRKRSDPGQLVQREAITTLIREGWGRDMPIFRQIFTSLFIPGASQEQMAAYNELQRATASPEEAARLHESFGDIDVTGLLSQVSVPTLVMHARGDAAVPFASGEKIAQGIPGARFVELDSANHILLANEPAFARFTAELRDFVLGETKPASPAPAIDTTRKQITALSAEIVSPLQVLGEDSLEQVMQALEPMVDLACETVERHGGTLISASDFRLAAIWGAPTTTEDHAQRACRAALALKKNLEGTSQGQARIRIGLDSGEAIIRPQRSGRAGAFGAVSNVVRRADQLASLLKRDTIVATANTRALAGGLMKMEPIDDALVGAAALGERIYEITAENRALSRWHLRTDQGLTSLVGRATELMLLGQSWQRAREGQGQLVGIVADPGVGKSRLSHEFLATEMLRNFTVLECGALEFDANVAFRVAKTLLHSLFGLDDGIDPGEAAASVTRRFAELGADRRLEGPISFTLGLPVGDQAWLALDAADRMASVRDAVRAVLGLECRRRPVVLLIEDMHWIDAESEAVINHIIDAMAAQRLMIIATFRPEYTHGWGQKSVFQQIRLGALSSSETTEFLAALLGADPSVDHLRPMLAEKSDGTPLFLEEMVRMLAETGRLAGERGAYTAPGEIGELQIPPSVKPIIAARIDRLAPEDRRVLQIAAVIGKDVPRVILKAMSGLKRVGLDEIIARLNGAELMFELQAYPETEYTFKHALTHDVAYHSLMEEDRRRIHAEALRLMEELYADQIDRHGEKLADHALRAQDWAAATGYLLGAAERALDLAAFAKGVRFLDHAIRAIEQLERTPARIAQAIDIRGRMRPALEGIDRFEDALVRLNEAEALAKEIGDDSRQLHLLLQRSYAYSTHGRLEQAIADADRLREMARAVGDGRFAAEADLAAAQALIFRHTAREVLELLEQHEPGFTGPWRMERFGMLGTRSIFFHGYIAMACALLGDFARAWRSVEEMNAVMRESGRPIDRYASAFHEAQVHIAAGPGPDYEARLAATAEDCLIKAPSPFYAFLMGRLGHVRLLCRDPESACEALDEAIARAGTSDMPHTARYATSLRACAEAQINGPEALPALAEALDSAHGAGAHWTEVIILRAMADVSEPAEGLALLDQAEKLALAQGFRPELARILAARAEIAEQVDGAIARRALEQARALFTEIGLEGEASALSGEALASA